MALSSSGFFERPENFLLLGGIQRAVDPVVVAAHEFSDLVHGLFLSHSMYITRTEAIMLQRMFKHGWAVRRGLDLNATYSGRRVALQRPAVTGESLKARTASRIIWLV